MGRFWYSSIRHFHWAPQILFKSQVRTLTVNEIGIHTIIGHKSGDVWWSQIAKIDNTGDVIYIIRTNSNSFLIPRRTFRSEQDRDQFLAKSQEWHSKATGNCL